jgi:hypothetical protein
LDVMSQLNAGLLYPIPHQMACMSTVDLTTLIDDTTHSQCVQHYIILDRLKEANRLHVVTS